MLISLPGIIAVIMGFAENMDRHENKHAKSAGVEENVYSRRPHIWGREDQAKPSVSHSFLLYQISLMLSLQLDIDLKITVCYF